MGDSDSERGWLDRAFGPLIAALISGLIAWGLGAPGWAIFFVAVGAANHTDFERRWSNFQEEWSDFQLREDACWKSLGESFEKNLDEYFEKNRR